MHVERNIEVRSLNHCCSGKAVSISHLCVYVLVRECVRAWALSRACVYGFAVALHVRACVRA